MDLLQIAISYLLVYIFSMIIHELGHASALEGLGLKKYSIDLWFYYCIPSMRTVYHGKHQFTKSEENFFYIMGGMSSAFLLWILSGFLFFVNNEIAYIFFSIGFLQFCYGIYEMLYIEKLDLKKYMIYHYILYIAIIILSIIGYKKLFT